MTDVTNELAGSAPALRAGAAVAAGLLLALAVALARGLARTRRAPFAAPLAEPKPARERRVRVAAGGAAGIVVLLVIALVVADAASGRRLHALHDDDPLLITMTAHRWWWEVTYDDSLPWRAVSTANELALPLGRAVRVRLRASDVPHSLSVPGLAAAAEVVPGRPVTLLLRADRLGRYAARCTVYCGLQHAHMSLTVTVMTPFDFYAWLDSAGVPAREPQAAPEQRGRELFVAGSCARCHTISGAGAYGTGGPDLTHLASRPALGAGAAPNSEAALAEFVTEPGRVKPGALMPPSPLSAADSRAIAAYLASLR